MKSGRAHGSLVIRAIVASVLILFAILLLILALYGLWHLTRLRWPRVLLTLFLLGGVLNLAYWGVQQFRLHLFQTPSELTSESFVSALAPIFSEIAIAKVRFGKTRRLLDRFLTAIMILTGGWVYLEFTSVKFRLYSKDSPLRGNLLRVAAASVLNGSAAWHAPIAFALVIAGYGLMYAVPDIRSANHISSVREFFALILVYTMARHLQYIVSPVPLPTLLRRAFVHQRSAHMAFIVVVLLDAVTLFLCISMVLRPGYGLDQFDVESVREFARKFSLLGVLRYVSDIVSGHNPPASDVLISGAGALYQLALLKTVLAFGQFRLNDTDYLAIAAAHCMMGDFSSALIIINRVEETTHRTLICRGAAYLGLGHIEEAWKDMGYALLLRLSGPPSPGQIFFVISDQFLFPIPKQAVISLFQYGKDNNVPEIAIFSSIRAAVFFKRIDTQNLLDIFGHVGSFQICRATALINENRFPEAEKALGNAKPTSISEKLAQDFVYLVISLETKGDDARIHIANWMNTVSSDLPFSSWEVFELVAVYNILLSVLFIAEKLRVSQTGRLFGILGDAKKVIYEGAFSKVMLGVDDKDATRRWMERMEALYGVSPPVMVRAGLKYDFRLPLSNGT